MVLLDVGLNEVADRLAPLVTEGIWGSGTTDPSPSDTGLETPIGSSNKTVTGTTSSNSMKFTHELTSTDSNGETLTEYGLKFDDATFLNRNLSGAISKTASFEVTTISTINILRG